MLGFPCTRPLVQFQSQKAREERRGGDGRGEGWKRRRGREGGGRQNRRKGRERERACRKGQGSWHTSPPFQAFTAAQVCPGWLSSLSPTPQASAASLNLGPESSTHEPSPTAFIYSPLPSFCLKHIHAPSGLFLLFHIRSMKVLNVSH